MRCGFIGPHADAAACIDALRSALADLEGAHDHRYSRRQRRAHPAPSRRRNRGIPKGAEGRGDRTTRL
jgi:hypothetical protein